MLWNKAHLPGWVLSRQSVFVSSRTASSSACDHGAWQDPEKSPNFAEILARLAKRSTMTWPDSRRPPSFGGGGSWGRLPKGRILPKNVRASGDGLRRLCVLAH